MKTVLLCGGFGTRIRDVAEDIPKPMIPIGDYPILWHIMKYYSHFSHNDFILCLGYKGNVIKNFFLNYHNFTQDFTVTIGKESKIDYHTKAANLNWKVTLADTGTHAMTGARIKKIQKYIGDDENFFLTYGDGVGNIDLDALLKFHKNHGKILTVCGVNPPGRFGEIVANENGVISEFNEKPQATGGRISGGFFVCKKEIFNYLNTQDSLVFEKEPIENLLKEKQLMMFEHNGFWQPMDTAREYSLLNSLYTKGEAPWVIWK